MAALDHGAGSALYAGGDFNTAGGVDADKIARWDGEAWSALGGGMSGSVSALTVFDDGAGPTLYAGGGFDTAGGRVNGVARWDGAGWSVLGGGLKSSSYVLTVLDDGAGPALYASGKFDTADGIDADKFARWDGAAWSILGGGIGDRDNIQVYGSLAVFDDGAGPALYAPGYSDALGGLGASFIAKWSCATEPLRDDVNGSGAQ